MQAISWVGFDGDDTLWKSEDFYRKAELDFESIIGQYIDLTDARTLDHLLEVERRNLRVFGYGAKGMTLSMVESAVQLTGERISARDIHRIIDIGRATLEHPVEVIEGVADAVRSIAAECEIVLITKGDLFHQESKIEKSGLSELFHRIEVVSEKDMATYSRVLRELDVPAERFVMIGNSIRSDIEPVIALGGWGIHVPYHITWAHEAEHALSQGEPRMLQVESARQLHRAVLQIAAMAAAG
ncbi:HAD family hydrolase [Pseudoxanthomonas gei]|uniref:HAD family hydrolase n=1 Tax=Pseudoxanthomonas gei TaxID=1383030 RepID=A0ABX0AAC3_9GAMM|nr:HAD family hydrolase [Pseudoxanthomonas gei]